MEEILTMKEMIKQIEERKRTAKNRNRPLRFTPAQVQEIRERYLRDYNLTYKELAVIYKASPDTIRRIISFKGRYGEPPYTS